MYKLTKCVLIICIGVFLSSCSESNEEAVKPKVNHKTIRISLSDINIQSEHTATLEGRQNVEIRPQVSGAITAIRIDEGATVRKGQVLFIIDQVPYNAALQTALANVKSAEAKIATTKLNLESTNELYKEKVVSEYDLLIAKNTQLEAEALLAQAKAQEVIARNDLSYTEVKSPVEGVASMIPYRIGALVSSSIADPLVTVSDDKIMHAYISMNEGQILRLTRSNVTIKRIMESMPNIELRLIDNSIYEEKGKIDAISGTIEKGTGAVKLRAVFANPNQILRNGGNGKLVIHNDIKDVIVIPQSATYELQTKTFVYKVVDGKAISAEVKISPLFDGREYIVKSGLEVGDVIIGEGAGLIKEGTPIN